MTNIHKTAIISPKAELGDNVTVGPYSIIEDDVIIGKDTEIASSALIASGTRLGENVKIFHSAVIGTVPQDLKFAGEKTTTSIGDNTIIREFVTINRGTLDKRETVVGKDCLIMSYAHVAHDCLLGDNVIMANSVNLAGHIEIGDYAILGGILPVHQFVKIGAHSMIGGGYRLQQDVCPYAMVAGYPLKIAGINSIGLKRREFSKDAIKSIKACYKLLFLSNLNTTQAIERIKSDIKETDQVKEIINFVSSTKRGMIK